MAISNIKIMFQQDIQKVWETVTSLENYAWRSDLSKRGICYNFYDYCSGTLQVLGI